jgi:hypothetical protein
MFNRLIATGLLAIASLWLVACGTGGVGSAGIPSKDQSHGGAGVKAGNFEVIRYNAAGFPDPALNSTLQLSLANKGGETALTIGVRDSIHTDTVALDVRYDAGSFHPEDVKFFGALGDDDQVLSASFLTQIPGTAAIGQAVIGDYRPARIDGSFAQVTFVAGGMRSVSAAGDPHLSPAGVGYHVGEAVTNTVGDAPPDPLYLENIVVDDDQTAHPGSVDLTWFAAWHLADGNQNGQVEIADLSPLGKFLNANVGSNFSALPADYNGDGVVSPSDLAKMGLHLGEGTEDYLVQVNDNNGTQDNLTDVGTFNWGATEGDDWTLPTDPNNATAPTPETLDPVFRKWTVTFDDASAVTMQQLADIDIAGNQDGMVSFHITPRRDEVAGPVTSSVDAEVGVPDTTRYITVNEVSIRVVGATGGGDDGTLFDTNNTAGSVVANSVISVEIDAIAGIYSSPDGGGAFNSTDTFPADMTQQDYDDALALAQTTGATGHVNFTVAQGGAPGFRYRSDWVTFPAAPAFGALGDGTVFPDDDPESTGALAEGSLAVNLNAATDLDGDTQRSIVFSNFNQVFLFDVTADPNAPLLADPINLQNGQPLTELVLLDGTLVVQDLTLPSLIQDPEGTIFELIEILPSGAAGDTIEFDYEPLTPAQGQFFVRTIDPPQLQAFVSGIAINASSQYHFTFKDDQGGPYSSLNTPEQVLTTAAPPPPQDLITIPTRLGLPGFATIKILMPDPVIRRDPRELINELDETITPVNVEGFNDVLKMSGDEIILGVNNGEKYPRFTIITNPTNDPNFGPELIDTTTPSEGDGSKALVTERTRNHVTVNLQGFQENWPTTGEMECAYKLFNENGTALGQGEMVMQALRFDDGPPTVTGPGTWGVNVFDRETTADAEIEDLAGLFTNKTIRLSNVGSPRPDVLWFQFNSGYVYDFEPSDGDNNVKAVFEWWDGNENEFSPHYAIANLRVAGIAPNGDFLALHVVTENDVFPNGNFLDGMSYIVHLDEQQTPGPWEATYGVGNPQGDENMLFVSQD